MLHDTLWSSKVFQQMQEKTIQELLQDEGVRAKIPAEILLWFEGTKKQRERLKVEQKKRRLHELIELSNLLPPTHTAANLDEIIGQDKEDAHSSRHEFSVWLNKYKLLLVYLEKFPSHFREYVLEDSQERLAQIDMSNLTGEGNITHFSKIYGALSRYDEFREVRDKFRKLIRIAHASSERQGLAHWFFMDRVSVHASLRVDKDGIVEISLDSFAETISGVDATRIRECNDCQRIFWAKRKDQSCCSKDCANRYHVRRYREKYASDPIAHKLRRLDREEKRGTGRGR